VAEALFAFLNDAVPRHDDPHAGFSPHHRRLRRGEGEQMRALIDEPLVIATNRKKIVPKTLGQKLYLQSMLAHPVVFGIGPAGTGKTYLAMAAAVSALLKNESSASSSRAPPSKPAKRSASSPATSAKKSSPTSARSTTRCTTCSTPRTSPASPKKA